MDNPQEITITESAAKKVAKIMAENGQESDSTLFLRVYVEGGGCSGMQYGFNLEEQISEGDIVFDQYGVRLVVDPLSLLYLTGSEIDFKSSALETSFIIRNPNATGSCGCGSSFKV